MADVDEASFSRGNARARKRPRSSRYVPDYENDHSREGYYQEMAPVYREYRDLREHDRLGIDVARKPLQSSESLLQQGKRKRSPGMEAKSSGGPDAIQDREPQNKKRNAELSKHLTQPPNQHNRKSANAQLRSLRRQLKHANNMRADLRQEKQRELSSLLVEKTRAVAKAQRKKNLEKYHLVRFVERQKCERQLKQLLKARKSIQQNESDGVSTRKGLNKSSESRDPNSDVEMDMTGGETLLQDADSRLAKQIHEMEVNLSYTIYAPLGDKYISLFPLDAPKKIAGMSRVDQARLTKEQREEVLANQNWNAVHNSMGEKPPLWYKVEECMEQGTLEQLRDGKLTAAAVEIAHVGGKPEDAGRANMKTVPDWMKDNGEIAPEDLDSESESDNDGGFFER